MDQVAAMLAGIDGWAIYLMLGLLVLGESAALVAVIMPGEIALVVAGALAIQGRVSLPAVIAVAVGAAVAGHAVGYAMGRRYGVRLRRWGPILQQRDRVDRAAALMATRGGPAVFLGRWTNVGRIVVPLLAGASRMPYGTFTIYNVLGGVAWAVAFTGMGAVAGQSWPALQRALGWGSWALLATVAVGLMLRWAWRRRARPVTKVAEHPGTGEDAPLCTVRTGGPSESRGGG